MDTYDIKRLQNGMPLEQLLGSFTYAYFKKLLKYRLVYIDEENKIYLTEKGLTAKKIGLEKYIELERAEKSALEYNPRKLVLKNAGLFAWLLLSILLLLYLNLFWI